MQLERLHLTYCKMTGYTPRYAIYEQAWYDFVKRGFTEADLRCVLLFLIGENRRNTYAYSLRLGKLLDFHYHHFADLLSLAQARQRNRRVRTGREQVLALYQRPVAESVQLNQAKSVKDILRSLL